MAKRPVFCPTSPDASEFVREVLVEFEWSPGFAVSQKQRSIAALHSAAGDMGISPVLEVSTKSTVRLGAQLSAFRLTLQLPGGGVATVESAFQGSKVFEHGGPYQDLYSRSPREAKRDERLKTSGRLVAFSWNGERWPLEPKTAFYDWLYLAGLLRLPDNVRDSLCSYKGFTDIEFNPAKSVNCQARAAALFVSLSNRGLLRDAAESSEAFLSIVAAAPGTGGTGTQQSMF